MHEGANQAISCSRKLFCRGRGSSKRYGKRPKALWFQSSNLSLFSGFILIPFAAARYMDSALAGRESGSIAAVSLWGFPARSPRSGRDLMTYHSEDRYGDWMAKTAADGRAEKWSRDGKGTLKTSPRICSPKARRGGRVSCRAVPSLIFCSRAISSK